MAEQSNKSPITSFRGPWTRLSNYAVCSVWWEDHMYPSTEHAYQAAKFNDEGYRERIREQATAALSKKTARYLETAGHRRKDWDDVKVGIMRDLLWEKFQQTPEKMVLLSTGDRELVEGNYWHDNFWGNCSCAKCKDIPGENWLGRLLMEVRNKLRENDHPLLNVKF